MGGIRVSICNCSLEKHKGLGPWRIVKLKNDDQCVHCGHYVLFIFLSQEKYEIVKDGQLFPKTWSVDREKEKREEEESKKNTPFKSDISSEEIVSALQRERFRNEGRRQYMPYMWIRKGYKNK